MMASLSVVTLYIACIFPAQQMSLPAIASLFVVAAVIEGRASAGFGVYAVSTVLGLLILPAKAPVLLFAFFFGLHPVLKSLFERLRQRWLAFLLKLAFFNAAFWLLWLLFSALLFGARIFSIPMYGLLPLLNGIFLLYDFGLSRLIMIYITRISRHIKK